MLRQINFRFLLKDFVSHKKADNDKRFVSICEQKPRPCFLSDETLWRYVMEY